MGRKFRTYRKLITGVSMEKLILQFVIVKHLIKLSKYDLHEQYMNTSINKYFMNKTMQKRHVYKYFTGNYGLDKYRQRALCMLSKWSSNSDSTYYNLNDRRNIAPAPIKLQSLKSWTRTSFIRTVASKNNLFIKSEDHLNCTCKI